MKRLLTTLAVTLAIGLPIYWWVFKTITYIPTDEILDANMTADDLKTLRRMTVTNIVSDGTTNTLIYYPAGTYRFTEKKNAIYEVWDGNSPFVNMFVSNGVPYVLAGTNRKQLTNGQILYHTNPETGIIMTGKVISTFSPKGWK